jgi:hypothetical protein
MEAATSHAISSSEPSQQQHNMTLTAARTEPGSRALEDPRVGVLFSKPISLRRITSKTKKGDNITRSSEKN